METIQEVASTEAPAPKSLPVLFNLSEEAVLHSAELLDGSGINVENFL
jgi:hypothetical protein